MLTRSFFVLVTTLVVAGSLAVASALATDEPAPKPGDSQTCVDKMRPVSHLGMHWRRSFRSGAVRGIAIDQGCGPAGTGKLRRVDVAISRRVGRDCQHLLRNGRLGRATACKPVWLRAKGKSHWTFRLRHKLPRGKYIVTTRAVDLAGNIERRR
jgi:hypothetical protein